jgi:8-oxo-dGTP pyrophosphatase MutT (NUDIX family)
MSFPGGRQDPGDPDLLATARRETHEEVGVDLAALGDELGRLSDLEAIARAKRVGLVIRPFVFAVPDDVPLVGNYEVAELLWAPLEPLLMGQADTTHAYTYQDHELQLPAYDVRGRIVWGLTHKMLTSLFEILR